MSSRFKKITIGLLIFFVVISLLIISSPTALTIIGWVYVAFVMSGGVQSIDLNPDKVTDRGSYYRITARYLVDKAEPIDFDIVTACGRSRIKTDGAEQEIILSVFAKRTRNNHAILISIPDFCSAVESRLLGQSGGEYDGSFLPFAVWFEDANNLEMGLGYASIHAYENPSARLTFRNTSIRYASREEFEDWYVNRNDNLISKQMIQASPYNESGWLIEEGLTVPDSCFGIGFVQANLVAQDIIDTYWPSKESMYWSKEQIGQKRWGDLVVELQTEKAARFSAYGFPTTLFGKKGRALDWTESNDARDGIGLNLSKLSKYQSLSKFPTEQYPVYYNDAVPFVRKGLGKNFIAADIDFDPKMRGFVSCYTRYSWTNMRYTWERKQEAFASSDALDHYFGGAREYNKIRLMVNGEPALRATNPTFFTNHLIHKDGSIGRFSQFSF